MKVQRYRRHNRYKTLERLYSMYTARGMYIRQVELFKAWLREDRT